MHFGVTLWGATVFSFLHKGFHLPSPQGIWCNARQHPCKKRPFLWAVMIWGNTANQASVRCWKDTCPIKQCTRCLRAIICWGGASVVRWWVWLHMQPHLSSVRGGGWAWVGVEGCDAPGGLWMSARRHFFYACPVWPAHIAKGWGESSSCCMWVLLPSPGSTARCLLVLLTFSTSHLWSRGLGFTLRAIDSLHDQLWL